MIIKCKYCSKTLAYQNLDSITVNGKDLPTDDLEAVILKCACGRTRRWNVSEYENQPKKQQKPDFNK